MSSGGGATAPSGPTAPTGTPTGPSGPTGTPTGPTAPTGEPTGPTAPSGPSGPSGPTGPTVTWEQGFEADTSGWWASAGVPLSANVRTASGTEGIPAATGGVYASLTGTPYTDFGGYTDTWPGGWGATIDIYLDPAWVDGKGFNYTVASNNATGTYLRDFALNVVKNAGTLLVAASHQAPSIVMPIADLNNYSPVPVAGAGWYTLSHTFRDAGGTLAVDISLTPEAGGAAVLTATLDAGDPIADAGGNRYGWFTVIDVDGGLPVDGAAKLAP